MNIHPSKGLGLALGIGALAALAGAVGFSLARLGESLISPLVLLWVLIPLLAVVLSGLILYNLYGLLTASYRLDRDGFYLRWGLAREQIPLQSIERVETAQGVGYPAAGFWWPGCLVGKRRGQDDQIIEFFSTRGGLNALLLHIAGERRLMISPPDLEAFRTAFVDATRLGSLQPLEHKSERPAFFFAGLWQDATARGLIVAGLAIPLLTLGYLGARAPSLPDLVPFGFDLSGNPDPMAPPGRLLLLPLIAAIGWLVDLGLGAWFYRRTNDRRLAYMIWAVGVLSGGLFLGAATILLS